MKLPGKITVQTLTVVILVALASTIAVSVVVGRQSRDVSFDTIKTSFTIIKDELSRTRGALETTGEQTVGRDDMGGKVSLILENKEAETTFAFIHNTIRSIAASLYSQGRAAGAVKGAVLDMAGDLVAFYYAGPEGQDLIGYAVSYPDPNYHTITLKAGQPLKSEAWNEVAESKEMEFEIGREILEQTATVFTTFADNLGLLSSTPVVSTEIDPKTNELKKIQVGVLLNLKPIGPEFSDRLSRLTGTKINLFAGQKLISGQEPRYKELKREGIADKAETWSLADQEVLLDQVDLDFGGFYRGVLPLYGNGSFSGAVADLIPSSEATAKTFDMIKLLGLVSLICLIIVVPLTLFAVRYLIRPVRRVGNGLTEGSNQVARRPGRSPPRPSNWPRVPRSRPIRCSGPLPPWSR